LTDAFLSDPTAGNFAKNRLDSGAASIGGDDRAGNVARMRRDEECDDFGDSSAFADMMAPWVSIIEST
jgi:hypothetical protein